MRSHVYLIACLLIVLGAVIGSAVDEYNLGICQVPPMVNADIVVKQYSPSTVAAFISCHHGYEIPTTEDSSHLCDMTTGSWSNDWVECRLAAPVLPRLSFIGRRNPPDQPPTVSVSFNTNKPLRNDLTSEYVSVNIDSASVGRGMDFADPVLNNLVKQLAPVLMRIGGTASNGIEWTGKPGMPCGCCGRAQVSLSTDCFDSIYNFLNYTGARLLFDFNAVRGSDGAWDSSNATALMEYAAAHGYGSNMGAWQLGNENPGITNGSQMGLDFLTAQNLARKYKLPDTIIGPSAGGTPEEWFEGFWKSTYGRLGMFSVHSYGGVNCNDASGNSFISRQTYVGFRDGLHGLVQSKRTYMAENTGILIEETAAAALGGCVNKSDRFIDGFYWMTIIGMPAEQGVTQINRQDVAGWSFLGLPSHYALAGPPGWTNGSSLLTPHADWYSTVLWKQLMGNSVLNFTWGGDADARSNVTIHAWCTPPAFVGSGSVTVSFVVGWENPVTLLVPSLASLLPRIQYILTSSAKEYYVYPPYHRNPTQSIPSSLFDDAIFLNGERMTVDAKGRLPQYPIPGNSISSGPPPVLPAYSYGFIVFPSANVAACVA